jgi:hypothetical protein
MRSFSIRFHFGVQQATKFEFVVHLKAAQQLGLTIPVRANQLIK